MPTTAANGPDESADGSRSVPSASSAAPPDANGPAEPSDPSPVSAKRVRSRRLFYLTNVLRSKDYFSLEEIRHREPAYYETEFLEKLAEGKRQRAEAREHEKQAANQSIVDSIYAGIDRADYQREVARAKAAARETEEEFESDSDSGADDAPEDEDDGEEDEGDDEGTPEEVSEFTRQTELRWLAGKDPHFDYGAVDLDPANDDPRIVEQDIQDAYFDADESEGAGSGDEAEGGRDGPAGGDRAVKRARLELARSRGAAGGDEEEYDY